MTSPQRKPKVTGGVNLGASSETLMLMESLKIYYQLDESALFELMTRKLFDETFYIGLSPLVKSIIENAKYAHEVTGITESAETEKIPK
jgi:hypothetical protein